jgi:hypothetical protein
MRCNKFKPLKSFEVLVYASDVRCKRYYFLKYPNGLPEGIKFIEVRDKCKQCRCRHAKTWSIRGGCVNCGKVDSDSSFKGF